MGVLNKTLGITAIVLALAGCSQKAPEINETATDNFKATATSEYELQYGENRPGPRHLDFSATKKGAYLIEGWTIRYRCQDKLDAIVSFEVTDLPFERRVNFSKDVYRVEVTYSDGKVMERSTVELPLQISKCN